MAGTLSKTTPFEPFYRFVRSLPLKACPLKTAPGWCVYVGTFFKADNEAPQIVTLVRFKPKENASALSGRSACLAVNEPPYYYDLPFKTINIASRGKHGINSFAVWSEVIPTQVAVSAEQVLKVPEEELLSSLDDDFPYVHKREDTLDLVKNYFDQSSGDAVVEVLQVSLVCPLSLKRMTIPCRGVGCVHVQCFDAYTYLAVNEGTLQPSWCCPVCNLELPVKDMRIDLFTLQILGEEHCDDVRFFADGKWENVAAGKDKYSVIVLEDSPVKTGRSALHDVLGTTLESDHDE